MPPSLQLIKDLDFIVRHRELALDTKFRINLYSRTAHALHALPAARLHEPPALLHLITERHHSCRAHEKDGSRGEIRRGRRPLRRGRSPRNRRRLDVVASIEGREAVVVRGNRERDAMSLRRRADVSTTNGRHRLRTSVRGLRLLVHIALAGAPTASANCLSNSFARRPGAGPSTGTDQTRATASGRGSRRSARSSSRSIHVGKYKKPS